MLYVGSHGSSNRKRSREGGIGPELERAPLHPSGAWVTTSPSAMRPPSGWTKWVHHPLIPLHLPQISKIASDAPNASFPNSSGGQTCQGSGDFLKDFQFFYGEHNSLFTHHVVWKTISIHHVVGIAIFIHTKLKCGYRPSLNILI